jgi:hypothetical protein
MKIGKTVRLGLLVVIVTFIFFDVTFPLDVASPSETRAPDPALAAEYERCYEVRDKEMHGVAFGTIDNPDVQKEFISTNRARIAHECRELFPERLIAVHEPARFNLVDLNPRFW